MYKDLKSTLIVGMPGTGKTYLISKIIKKLIEENKNQLYLVDPKCVELFQFKNEEKVVYINSVDDIEEKMISPIKENKSNETVYVFIDEYAEVKFNEKIHKQIKQLIKDRKKYNVELILTSQIRSAFCQGMRMNMDTILFLNSIKVGL